MSDFSGHRPWCQCIDCNQSGKSYCLDLSFKETVDLVSGKANLEVRSTSGPFMDQSALNDLSWLGTVGGKYMPMIEQTVVVADKK